MTTKQIQSILEKFKHDKSRLMDILLEIQRENGFIPKNKVETIAGSLNMSAADVEQTISFYHFFSCHSRGKYSIYLNNSLVAMMKGRKKVAEAFETELGCNFGEVTEDGLIGIFDASCIGMSDQEPAALINGKVFTNLTSFRVREIIRDMRKGMEVEEMYANTFGDSKNSSKLVNTVVRNHIKRTGPILNQNFQAGKTLRKQMALMTPEEVINEVKRSHLRGRGGAGFPTGIKWEFCRRATGTKKYVFCNADEGEPGTFKDRVILTEKPEMLFEGMVIAAYAIGASEGILYLRYEYSYLKNYLEDVLDKMRKDQNLGKNSVGIKDFNFDIRIQLGAGAYICGEESALIESAEGKRGEPRNRPPFPVEKGYLGFPTVINNVETLCSSVRIIQNGGEWYKSLGTKDSTGTKILSISGDCLFPGIYELEWGFTINTILEMAGAHKTQAVQIGGPSGALINPDQFDRIVCYSDLATGGSIIILDESRDLLKDVVMNFTDFFIEESCGSCVPCRNIPTLLKRKLIQILEGKGTMKDFEDSQSWANMMQINRCGLGHTAANPVITSLKNFRHLYEDKIQKQKVFESGFDIASAVAESCEFVDRDPNI